MFRNLTFFSFFLFKLLLFSQSNHTITIDGTINTSSGESWSTVFERFSTSSGVNVYGYMTWDANNFYVSWPQVDFDGFNQAVFVVLDTDPQSTPKSGNGKDSLGYDQFFRGSTVVAPFNADYIFMIKENNSALEKYVYSYSNGQWNLNGANGTTDLRSALTAAFGNASGNNKDIELSISRSAIGLSASGAPMRVIIYCKNLDDNSGWGYLHRAVPDNGTTDGLNDKIFAHWYGFSLRPGENPNAGSNYDKNDFSGWDVLLSANISSLSLSDAGNIAGVSPSATDGYDAGLDVPKPPEPPSNYVYFTFPHSDWPLGPNFKKDIRANKSLDTSTISWDFTVSTDRPNVTVSVAASDFADVPSAYDIYLKDMTTNALHNLRANSTYSYNSGSSPGSRNFKLIIGKYVPNLYAVSSLAFGNVKIDFDSSKTLTLFNTGLDTLKISNVTISGIGYSFSGLTLPLNIPSGSSANVTVKFSPINAGNSSGELKIFSNDPDNPEFTVSLSGTGTIVTLTKKFPKGWNLIGIPLITSSPKADSIFKPYASNYLLYNYRKETGYNISDSVFLGEGYWLGIYDTVTVSVQGLPVTKDTTVNLRPGWNIFSHVFIKDIRKANLNVIKGAETVSFDSAVSKGWLQSVIYKFNRPTNSYMTVDTLDQFDGYWISTLVSDLKFKFLRSAIFGTPYQKINKERFDKNNWKLNLTARNSVSSDMTTEFGLSSDATEGFDPALDNAKPPVSPVDGAVELYFRHNDWNPLFTKYAADIRNINSSTTLIWPLEFFSKKAEKTVIEWGDISPSLPSGVNAYLYDLVNGSKTDLRSGRSYEFDHTGGIRKFEIIVPIITGLDEKITPVEFSLAQNYPNPFNPGTIITYSIPKEEFVSLKVFDILGREISTLVNELKKPGIYSVDFSAENLSTGIYIYVLKSGNFTATKKMQVIK